jgi:alkanesulfonate monooxygenase SsuD/methylene tetrahydromethanopterin reductase-like flavin-dependent oxidoreductase (luciferase family)
MMVTQEGQRSGSTVGWCAGAKKLEGHTPRSLAWLGGRTWRVQMGTSVLTPTFRYYPSIIAQAFGTQGAAFPGRVTPGNRAGLQSPGVARSGARPGAPSAAVRRQARTVAAQHLRLSRGTEARY